LRSTDRVRAPIELLVDPSAYALVHGVRSTRRTLEAWRADPGPVLRDWLLGSVAAAVLLLGAIWLVAISVASSRGIVLAQPPLVLGDATDVIRILSHNFLVLALHAMACVAGFIAGSSLPLQAEHYSGVTRLLHERGRPVAIGFVICATCFSLSWQAYAIGSAIARVAAVLHAPPALLLVGLLPHALPELVALFLPLAAWVSASRRGEWDGLLAATIVTVALALPVLLAAALWEVYVAPHLLQALFG
jgi:hypothetical protein